MSSIRIKVTASPVTLTVDKSEYQERWAEHCVENDDVGEGQSAGEPSDEFVIECVQDEILTRFSSRPSSTSSWCRNERARPTARL
jgi:hypothetical protein